VARQDTPRKNREYHHYLLKRDEGDITHIYTFTFWEDIEAIKRFAGEELERARYYPEDKDFLLEFELPVTHFDVLEAM
jgi:hypothetical protein